MTMNEIQRCVRTTALPVSLAWSSIHLWSTRTLCGGRRLAGVISLRRLAALLDPLQVDGSEETASLRGLDGLLDEAGA